MTSPILHKLRSLFIPSRELVTEEVLLGVPRSPKWRKLKLEYQSQFPTCAACGTKRCINIHHILPVWKFPHLELVWENLISLCDEGEHNCHLHLGHLHNFKSYNPDIVEHAKLMLAAVLARP